MDTLNAALQIASQGFPVFPVRLCLDACLKCNVCKSPATPHGFHDASSNPDPAMDRKLESAGRS